MNIGLHIREFERRAISIVEVVENALSRAEASSKTLNAFATLCHEQALADAKRAEAAFRNGCPMGPLAGIPISIKDNIITKGIRTTFGSPSFAENVPDRDSVSVSRLRGAGAVIIGKTTTPEFACRQTTSSALFGITRNPYDTSLTPGGSSGGSSASIAAGIGCLSLVTDGGGSARLPAACTGVVGFKPTLGRIPFDVGQDAFGGLGHFGLMARSVQDISIGFSVLSGRHPSDPYSNLGSFGMAAPPADRNRPLAGLRVGGRERLRGERIDPSILGSVERCLRNLEVLGAVVEPIVSEIDAPLPIWRILQHAIWAARYAGNAAVMRTIDPVIAAGIEDAQTLSACDLQEAHHGRTRLFRRVQQWLEDCDIIASPTLTRPPMTADHPGSGAIDVSGVPAGDIREAWGPMLGLFTMTGHPSISMNCGWTENGLPVGLHLVGRWNEDEMLLRTAEILESALAARPGAIPAGRFRSAGRSGRAADGDGVTVV